MYRQSQLLLYNPVVMHIPMLSGDIEVNYIELLDASCVEFPHTHTNYEIYYCLEGVLRLKINEAVHELRTGMFALLSPGVAHGSIYEPNDPKKYFVFIFHFPEHSIVRSSAKFEFAFFDTFNVLFQKKQYFVGTDQNQSGYWIDEMKREMEKKAFGWEILLRNLYLEFMIQILRNLIPVGKKDSHDLSSNVNIAIQITKYLHDNYYRSIKIQDVADAIYVTPRHINRIFQEFFGQSLQKTLGMYRLNYAKNYLLDTDYPVEKIAVLVGFSSARPLFRLFREMENITVSEYRALHKIDTKRAEHHRDDVSP